MIVASLLGIVIAIVVGVSLISTISNTVDVAKKDLVEEAAESGTEVSSSVTALLDVLPIVFVVVIILGAISWMGFSDDAKMPSFSWLKGNGKKALGNGEELIARITKASENWGEYINNLDAYLGIETVNAYRLIGMPGLILNEKGALIIGRGHDWYITDKNPEQPEFKVVGLHKKDAEENQVYLLGNNGKEPYLRVLPVEYIEADYGYRAIK